MTTTGLYLKNAQIINEGQNFKANLHLADGLIQKIGDFDCPLGARQIDASGKVLLPGLIDAQVHFREPGLSHKADLASESKAALAGGVCSFIDMPNTLPNVLDPALLAEKYRLAAERSWANYGFLLGVNADNLEAVLALDTSELLAITDDGLYFSKKGNLLADNPAILEKLFAGCPALIAIHAEKEQIIEANEALFRAQYGEKVPFEAHPKIRSTEACFAASKEAIALAEKHGARLHILHLSTGAETELFSNALPLAEKKITTEASIHHLWFCDEDYAHLGPRIKWNPAIKSAQDRDALWQALLDDRIDLITTDHAPHSWEEKAQNYFQSMSGAPMVQHALSLMLEMYHRGVISLEKIVEKMCHNPAILYQIERRGYIREGYYADLTLVDLEQPWTVKRQNLLYKCGWSPLEGLSLRSRVSHSLVNGQLVYEQGQFINFGAAMALRKSASAPNHV